jgi:hypothetical protein
MALSARKRQQKVERRNAKQKARQRTQAQKFAGGLAARLEKAATAPILHCYRTSAAEAEGIANVLVSRLLPSGNVAFAVFLVDLYCLGVKNAVCDVGSRGAYESRVFGQIFRNHDMTRMQPEAARKLVEGAVAYARDLGFAPHPDYATAKAIFGDLDPAATTETFTYGKDGKPFFISGPHDTPARCRKIVSMLTARCGAEGFHYVIGLSPYRLDEFDLEEIDGEAVIYEDEPSP